MSDKESRDVKKEENETEKDEEEEEEEKEEVAASTEPELPPEVDAFFKGKNKYKHPYGDWRPVVKAEPLKRKTFGDQLDLPADNWHLPENQFVPIIPETKEETQVKLVFKEREITSIPSSSSSKASGSTEFKKRKTVTNRQLRGTTEKDERKKSDPNES